MTRILINPDSLRATANRLNEAASELGLYARSIGNTDVSAFAPDIRGIAMGVTRNVGRELVTVSSELGQEADVLRTRAGVVERSSVWGITAGPLVPITGTARTSELARGINLGLQVVQLESKVKQLRSNVKTFALKWGNQYGKGYVVRDGKAASKYVRDLLRNGARTSRFVKVAGAGVITGSLAAVEGWRDVQQRQYGASQRPGLDRDDAETWGDAFQTVSGGMTAVGSGLLLAGVVFPPAAPIAIPVGAGTVAVSVGFDVAGAGLGYVADNWGEAQRAWSGAAKRFTNFARSL